MAKLYAEITSDKGGRVASKGGNEYIEVTLKVGNVPVAHIALWPCEHAHIWQNSLKITELCHAIDTVVEKKQLT